MKKKYLHLTVAFIIVFFLLFNVYAEEIDFEGLPAGTILHTVFGNDGSGPITVTGTNPLGLNFPVGMNAAVVIDSSNPNPNGLNFDIGSPNVTCQGGGPGIGEGGEIGEPFENCMSLGNVLIVANDLDDLNNDGLVDNPDDIRAASVDGSKIVFNFSTLGAVTAEEVNLLDVDGNAPNPRVELYNAAGALVDTFPILQSGDNGYQSVDLDSTEGIVRMEVWLQGSGTIASVVFIQENGGGDGCTPGYWKQNQHFWAWEETHYAPDTLFADVFEDAFPGMTLLEVLKQGGGGLNALGRHSVAALLNSFSPGVSYDLAAQEVIDSFNEIYPGSKNDYNSIKDVFEEFNEQGCSLGNNKDEMDNSNISLQSTEGSRALNDINLSKGGSGTCFISVLSH